MRWESVNFWTRHNGRSRETSSYGGRELEDRTVKTKELYQQKAKRIEF
jgi:hypothetical protein